MQQPEAVQGWRNRQAEIEFHLCRLQWFLSKAEGTDPSPLQKQIERYQKEWNLYQERIGGGHITHRKLKKDGKKISGTVHAA